MRRRLFLCLCAALLAPPAAHAQQATPDHVFQRTEEILLHLDLLNSANFSESAGVEVPSDPTRPRHVLQSARDVWRKLQLLRYMNGLPTASLDPVPAREVTPADVKDVMDRVLSGVVDLRGAYGVDDPVTAPAVPFIFKICNIPDSFILSPNCVFASSERGPRNFMRVINVGNMATRFLTFVSAGAICYGRVILHFKWLLIAFRLHYGCVVLFSDSVGVPDQFQRGGLVSLVFR